jgi:hypothetical protein
MYYTGTTPCKVDFCCVVHFILKAVIVSAVHLRIIYRYPVHTVLSNNRVSLNIPERKSRFVTKDESRSPRMSATGMGGT